MLAIHQKPQQATSTRRKVRPIRGGQNSRNKPINISNPKMQGFKSHLPFHLSPRPLFSKTIMDSLLCDIINHSRQQKGQQKAEASVLILNKPSCVHERKVASKRGLQQSEEKLMNIDTRKLDQIRPAIKCIGISRQAKRRKRVISSQELLHLESQVEKLLVCEDMYTCAPPPNTELHQKTNIHPLTTNVRDDKTAHIESYRKWKSQKENEESGKSGAGNIAVRNNAALLVEELQLTSAEEELLNKEFEKLVMEKNDCSGPPLIIELPISPRAVSSSANPP
jgi:hypothetical protein